MNYLDPSVLLLLIVLVAWGVLIAWITALCVFVWLDKGEPREYEHDRN
jgi:hypothetical protein